jgi:hypothetical protein
MSRFRITTFALVGIFVYASVSHAQMTSTNYQIRWDSISTGGSDTSSSASYELRDSLGHSGGEQSTSTNYRLNSGYRSGIFDQIITFDLLIQNLSTAKATTAYAGNTITADPSGISVNDYILLVQNLGGSQVAGVGRVTAVGAGIITIDTLATGASTPTIDGTNDYIYRLNGSTIGFGDLDTDTISTAIIAFEVTAVNDNGYVVQVFEDGNLRDGSDEIDDVTDGSVSADREEYGAISSDTSIADNTFDTDDTAITTTATSITTQSSSAYNDRHFVTMKLSIDDSTPDGSFGHVISLIASGNF